MGLNDLFDKIEGNKFYMTEDKRHEIISCEWEVNRYDASLLLQSTGHDDIIVPASRVVVRQRCDQKHYKFSLNDYFPQADTANVERITDAGVFFLRFEGWEPYKFALLPDRIMEQRNMNDTDVSGRFYAKSDGKLIKLINVAGDYLVIPTTKVHTINEPMSENTWFVVELEYYTKPGFADIFILERVETEVWSFKNYINKL